MIAASLLMLSGCNSSGAGDGKSGSSSAVSVEKESASLSAPETTLIPMEDLVPKESGLALGDQLSMPEDGDEIAVITMEDGGVIKLRFFQEEAPKAVYSFKTHAKEGYYDGLIFHRIIPQFMIQGGDPQGLGIGGESVWGTAFEDEFSESLVNITGSVSMANSGPNTNGSQFFINYAPGMSFDWGKYGDTTPSYQALYEEQGGSPHLDGTYNNNVGHTVFAQVFEGLETVAAISETETGEGNRPVEDVVIRSVEIVPYRS